MEGYDQAQICVNGHIINDTFLNHPEHNAKFCTRCGEPTITNCPSCKIEIQGDYYSESIGYYNSFTLPLFCHECGKPYPWTEKKIKAAQELAQELDISSEEKFILTETIPEIVSDSPKTIVAATKFKKIISKVGTQFRSAFRDILVDLVSETAKKMIWP